MGARKLLSGPRLTVETQYIKLEIITIYNAVRAEFKSAVLVILFTRIIVSHRIRE